MNAPRADALVLFGATGDLAAKKIYPALQQMIRRGHPEPCRHRKTTTPPYCRHTL